MDASEARVLEIGDLKYHQGSISRSHHAAVDRIASRRRTGSNGTRRCRLAAMTISTARPASFMQCHARCPRRPLRSRRRLSAALFAVASALWRALAVRRTAASLACADARLRRVVAAAGAMPPVPLVAVDLNDHFGIRRPGFFLLDKADVVFKRELPADRWRVLAHSAHPALPTLRIRSNPRWQRRLEKLRPMSLPPPAVDAAQLWDGAFPDKTADIFFSGNTAGELLGPANRNRGDEATRRARHQGRYSGRAAAARGILPPHVAGLAGVVARGFQLGMLSHRRGGAVPDRAGGEPSDGRAPPPVAAGAAPDPVRHRRRRPRRAPSRRRWPTRNG